jgi:hypothetical protein
MLRIYLMQQWFNFSDRQMEDALYEIESIRHFADFTTVTVTAANTADITELPKLLRAGACGASVPGHQAPVWLHQGALPRTGEECSTGEHAGGAGESLFAARSLDGVMTPEVRPLLRQIRRDQISLIQQAGADMDGVTAVAEIDG